MPPDAVPTACEVLVVGAGPAGSACAQKLAEAGFDVLLADQHAFPRDKVCGDGLIPDAHAALRRLGVHDEVMDQARRFDAVRCIAPRGGHVDVPGALAVLSRRQLDDVLCRAAQRAGARLLAPARFEAPLREGGRVTGARLNLCGTRHDVAARWLVLATGAVPQALLAADACERRAPSCIALRGYVRHDGLAERLTRLQIAWHPRLQGGYGWIFPGPGGVFNIGVGLTASHAARSDGGSAMRDANLRQMFDAFCAVHAPAAELMAGGTPQGALKGAPLRCSLTGAPFSMPGLLITGEAAGSTYAMTGEGIGKALETGMLAAEALRQGRGDDTVVRPRYETAMRALRPKFDLYERASRVNDWPWLTDLVVWRARRSPRILRRMAGVLDETQSPGRLFSWRGITRLMFE